MKVTLLNLSDPTNKGDYLITENTIKLLKKFYNPEISIINVDFTEKQIIERNFDVFKNHNIKNLGSLFPKIYNKTNRLSKILESLIALKNLFSSLFIIFLTFLFRERVVYLITPSKRKIINAIKDTDLIIIKGGSYIYSFGGIKELIFLYRMLITSIIAIFLNKKIIAFSHSMGPFVGKLQFFLAKWTLLRFNKIILREKISFDYLKDIMKINENKLQLLPDIVYWGNKKNERDVITFIEILESENIKIPKEKLSENLKVGFTLRYWHFPLEKPEKREELLENYIECVCNLIDYLSKHYNALCFIFPHVLKDIPFSLKIKERVNSNNLYVLKGDYSVETLKKLYGNMDIFIGTRIHSDIFALSQGVPTLGLAYELHKGLGSFEMIGLEDLVIDLSKMSKKELIERVNHLIKNKEDLNRKITERISSFHKTIEDYVKKNSLI